MDQWVIRWLEVEVMTKAERFITARQFGKAIPALLFLLCPLTVAGQSEQKPERAEDAFVARNREAVRKNPEGVSFTLSLEEDKIQFKPGEIIRVEFSFTSDAPNVYDLNGATYDRGGRLGLDKYFLDHKKGVVDPLSDRTPGPGGGIRSDPT